MNAAGSTTGSTPVAEAERELVVERTFNAPRELVFKAWTHPKHLEHWFGPAGFTNTTHEADVRPGGVWRYTMHGPDGVDYPNKIVFDEIAYAERLTYTHSDDGDEGGSEPFHVTVTFDEPSPNVTKLTMRMLFASPAELQAVKEMGAVEGANSTLDRLAQELATMSANQDVVIERIFDAPRELVFRMWTEAEHVKEWWGPAVFTNPLVEIDARPGGTMLIHMQAPDGAVYPDKGVFREVVPPERLVFTSGAFEDENGNFLLEALTTVTFVEQGGKTKMTLTATVLKAAPEVLGALAGMEQGWSESFDKLDKYLAQA